MIRFLSIAACLLFAGLTFAQTPTCPDGPPDGLKPKAVGASYGIGARTVRRPLPGQALASAASPRGRA